MLNLTGIERNVTPTQSRIAAATHIATTTPEKTQLVADYMGHQANTAEKYYRKIEGGGHLMEAYDAIGLLRICDGSNWLIWILLKWKYNSFNVFIFFLILVVNCNSYQWIHDL